MFVPLIGGNSVARRANSEDLVSSQKDVEKQEHYDEEQGRLSMYI